MKAGWKTAAILVAAACAAARGSDGPADAGEAGAMEAARSLVDGNTAFALRLYDRLRGGEANLFFSPHSISTALAMAYAGAAGATAEQMAETLAFALPPWELHGAFAALEAELRQGSAAGAYELRAANALWAQKDFAFLDSYLDLLRKTYGAPLRLVDFMRETEQARRAINAWVEETTNDKIQDLFTPGVLDEITRLVLVNAIYFRGFWEAKFDAEATRDAPFTLPGGETADVPMMHREDAFAYAETAAAQILELPYRGGDLSMVVVLPRAKDGLPTLETSLSAAGLRAWTESLARARVSVHLPRFSITSQFSLADALEAMGMADAFSVRDADFSAMTGDRDLFISAVVHKAFVAVDEEGTEAAAATGVVMGLRSVAVPRPPRVFRADHPFLFLIRHRPTGAILFLGRVNDPR